MEKEQIFLTGRKLTADELEDVKYIIHQFSHLSRHKLAKTICEGLDWVAPNGKYKKEACLHLLEKLESDGILTLPEKRASAMRDSKTYTNYATSDELDEQPMLEGPLSQYAPITLTVVRDTPDIRLWNSFVERYHTLGYKRPFGAHQRYFIWSGTAPKQRLGCLLFSASAWALAERDQWLGWSQQTRSQRLHLIVNNTRFLLFPWVRVKNLASQALALASRQITIDWQERYGYKPVLLETFVDTTHYLGTCYRAANWMDLGVTTGRGRMDRKNEGQLSRKRIFVYPLQRDFRMLLCSQSVIGGEPDT